MRVREGSDSELDDEMVDAILPQQQPQHPLASEAKQSEDEVEQEKMERSEEREMVAEDHQMMQALDTAIIVQESRLESAKKEFSELLLVRADSAGGGGKEEEKNIREFIENQLAGLRAEFFAKEQTLHAKEARV